MNSKLIAVGVIAVLLIGGGIVWVQTSDEAKAPDTVDEGATVRDEEAADKQETSGLLKDLLAQGRAQKCTFSDTAATGVVYVGNNKGRGDFTSTAQGQATTSHMIVDGATAYVWVDGQPTGFKMSLDAAAPSAAAGQAQQFDADTKVDYSCEAWSIDSAQFTPPTSVQFSDMSALLKAAPGQAANCAACDSAPADSRAQCRAALGCN